MPKGGLYRKRRVREKVFKKARCACMNIPNSKVIIGTPVNKRYEIVRQREGE